MARKADNVEANVILIRELMRQKQLNITELAKQLDLSREMLSGVLNERHPLTRENWLKIAEILGVPPESLLVTTEKLLLRKFKQMFIQYALNDQPSELDPKTVMDIAVRLGIVKEVNPYDVQHDATAAEQALKEAMENL